MSLSKKRKAVADKVEKEKLYSFLDAAAIVKEVNTTKFDSSVDIHIRLGLDPTKSEQALRGTVSLPHGTGKDKKVLVLCTPDKEEEAKEAGADYVGLDEFIQKIESGWTDIDVIVSTPSVMPKIGRLGKVLGPRNLMPNPKTGTVTNDITQAVQDLKKGKIAFKIDKAGIIHCSIGRVSFSSTQIAENAQEIVQTIIRLKPPTAKGIYLKSIYLVSTMSPSVSIDTNQI